MSCFQHLTLDFCNTKSILYSFKYFRNFVDNYSLMTKIQITTIVLILAYLVWELLVWFWIKGQPESGGTIIRVDLIIIFPILLTLIIISLYQYFKK